MFLCYFGNWMKSDTPMLVVSVIAIVAIGTVLSLAILYPSGFNSNHTKTVTVSSTGYAVANPSEGLLYLSITGTGNTTTEAYSNFSSSVSVFNTTMAPYINDNFSLVKTTNYQTYKIYNESRYAVSESLKITIPNISDMSSIFTSLSSINAISVSSTTSQITSLQRKNMTNQALALAMMNATQEALALTNNATIYPVNITLVDSYVYPVLPLAMSTSANPSTQTFFPGQYQVVERVLVTFSYEKK